MAGNHLSLPLAGRRVGYKTLIHASLSAAMRQDGLVDDFSYGGIKH
jgi:hypothetical protein